VNDLALAYNLLLFGRLLRATGLEVHHGRLLDAIRAVDLVGVKNRSDVHATLRALLVHRRDDFDRFDRVFDLFFRPGQSERSGPLLHPLGPPPRLVIRSAPEAPVPVEFDEVNAEGPSGADRAVGAWSASGVSRTKDFGDFTAEELERACALLEDLPWELGERRTRRWTVGRRGTADLRPLIRHNIMRGGDLVELPRRERRVSTRPIVLLADVSGSMERYSRAMLHFVYGLAHSGAKVESFVFATHLTRLTSTLAKRRGSPALERAVNDVRDWGGGTRIGLALRTFNTTWARRVMRNGPIVLIVSDGWDRGDPALLSRELARLGRSSRRLIWLNPLLGSSTYEPLTRGMQAALRHLDDFLPAHNVRSLEQLAARLRSVTHPR